MNLRMTDRRTNYVSFHPSNWNSSKTDGQTTIHLILSYWILRNTDGHIMRYVILQLKSSQDRQTDKLRFISILKLESKFDRRTNYVFFHPSYCNLSKTDRRTNYVSFDSSYCSFRQTDKLRSFHPSNVDPRQTTLLLESLQDKRTNVSFHNSFWNPRQTTYVSFHPSNRNLRNTSRRTNYETFHPSYWNLRKTDGQTTFHFIPNIEHFILGCKYDRQTDKPSFSSYCRFFFYK